MPVVSTAVVGLSLLAVAASPVASVEAPRPASKVRLEYRFQEEDVLRLEIQETSRLIAVKGETRQEQGNKSTTESRYVVREVSADGIATLRSRIVAAQMQCRFDDAKPIRFDSREEATPPAFRNVRAVIGVDRVEIEVKPDGTLVGARSLMKDQAARANPVGEDDLSLASADVFPLLPTEPVSAGAEWTRIRTMRVSVGEGLNNRLTREVRILDSFRLEEIEDGVAAITYRSAPLTAIDDPTIQLQVAPQKASGTIRFDVARGRVLERTKKVDNLTIGWQGPDSSLMTQRTRTERLMPAPQSVSSRE